ncbi:unnamed protein product [Commensalibacter communis]|uniref:hypothetical protein n=1 Tax=Commensalibacter communis TaxID=2972786 RepID=UPI0022FF7212|nr:hypothetical protein [Commensalibacter communis]CAI3922671.1 unnamed protein product [Commensalibacter communis]
MKIKVRADVYENAFPIEASTSILTYIYGNIKATKDTDNEIVLECIKDMQNKGSEYLWHNPGVVDGNDIGKLFVENRIVYLDIEKQEIIDDNNSRSEIKRYDHRTISS